MTDTDIKENKIKLEDFINKGCSLHPKEGQLSLKCKDGEYYYESNGIYYKCINQIYTNTEIIEKPDWWDDHAYCHYMKNTKDKIFKRCSDIHHYSQKELKDTVIPELVKELLKTDIKSFIKKYILDKIDSHKEYQKFKELSSEKIEVFHKNSSFIISPQKTTNSIKICRKYMPHFYEVEDSNGNKLEWNEDKLLKSLLSRSNNHTSVNSQATDIIKSLNFKPVTMYSPIMTRIILEELGCKNVFDPCIGWGGRLIGTTATNGYYCGFEPFTKTYDGLNNMVNELSLNGQVDILKMQAELGILDDTIFEGRMFDICLTSPPYFDLEIYSDEATQSVKQYPDYNQWLDKFIEPLIEFVSRRVTKYSCWSVKNFGKYKFMDDIIRIHNKHGWIRDHRTFIVKGTNRVNAGAMEGELTLVFKKDINPS